MSTPTRHRRSRQRLTSRVPKPLFVLVPLLVVVIVAALMTDDPCSGHGAQTARQTMGVPVTTPEPASPQRACERAVTQALARLAVTLDSGGTADQAVVEEQARLDTVEYEAYSVVINDFMMARGRHEGLAAQVKTVAATFRQVCSRAT